MQAIKLASLPLTRSVFLPLALSHSLTLCLSLSIPTESLFFVLASSPATRTRLHGASYMLFYMELSLSPSLLQCQQNTMYVVVISFLLTVHDECRPLARPTASARSYLTTPDQRAQLPPAELQTCWLFFLLSLSLSPSPSPLVFLLPFQATLIGDTLTHASTCNCT